MFIIALTYLLIQTEEEQNFDSMRSSWGRTLGNVRSFLGNSMGGLRGGTNLASWAVAGTLAYYLWVKPARDLQREQEVCLFVVGLYLDPYTAIPISFELVWGLKYSLVTGKGSACSFR